MSDSPYPSQTQDKFVLRLPDGMRDRIKRVAEANNRSMNAEIVATLEEAYPVTEADFERLAVLVAQDGRPRETTIEGKRAKLERLDDGRLLLTYLEP